MLRKREEGIEREKEIYREKDIEIVYTIEGHFEQL